jgi:two-component system, NtrC family, sensor kinase
VGSLNAATWSDINALRDRMAERGATSVEHAAQSFAEDLATSFSSVVLARVFIVLPLSRLPEAERHCAENLAGAAVRIPPETSVLSLLGTFGREPAWCDRRRSEGHRAIPLLSRAFVQGAPMIARLLADLEVDLAGLDDGRPIDTRRMLGGRNGRFFVPDAATSSDALGRHVIPAREFVSAHKIVTVFGMGGAYGDGSLAVVIAFTNERLDALAVDRFPSLISNFKMATADP